MRGFYRHFTVFSIKTAIAILPIDGPMYLYIRVKSDKIIVSLKENTNRRQIMKKTYLLEDLCCANCAAAIERGVAKIEGVNSASVNFLTTKMILDVEEEGYEETFKKIKKLVKKTEPDVTIKEI